jgi:hypothetical protein
VPSANPSAPIARAYDRHLFNGGTPTLQDLPDRPRFVINATNLGWDRRIEAGLTTVGALASAAQAGGSPVGDIQRRKPQRDDRQQRA